MAKLYLVCGKGGVGKTTVASAIALGLSSSGVKTLLLSTDFSPALGDVLNTKIGPQLVQINQNLYAIEIDQKTITNRWVKKFGPDFNEILSRLIDTENLDRESKHNLLEYISSAPALKEETMLDFIVEMYENGDFDKIIWDSAPAGETLNLLSMPLLLKKHLKSGTKIYDSIDKLTKFISHRKTVSEIIEKWITLSDYIYNFIRTNASFVVVTNPEKVVYQRTVDIIKSLTEYDLHIHGCVINKIIKNIPDDALINEQLKILDEIYKLFNTPIVEIDYDIQKIRSLENITKTGNQIIDKLKIT